MENIHKVLYFIIFIVLKLLKPLGDIEYKNTYKYIAYKSSKSIHRARNATEACLLS